MSFYNFLKEIFTGTGSDNTGEGAIIRAGGKHISKTVTLNASVAKQDLNLFEITGNVKIIAIHGHITDNTVLTNMTDVNFNLYDGTATVQLTKATGASMSGFGVGAFFYKAADAAALLTCIDNASGALSEPTTGQKEFQPFILIKKTGASTYIRLTYTTTDAPINAQVEVHLEYVDINSGDVILA